MYKEATLIILILFSISTLSLVFLVIKQKQKLIKDRKRGLIDQHILIANCEKTIKKIQAAGNNDPNFTREIEKIYFDGINSFISGANFSIDRKDVDESVRYGTYEKIFELTLLALLHIRRLGQLKEGVILKGEIPFTINDTNIIFDDIKYEEVTVGEIKK